MNSVEPQLAESISEKLPPDLRPDALPPDVRMHDVRDLALALDTTANEQLAHTHNIAHQAGDEGEPALGVSDQARTAPSTNSWV